MRNTLIFAIAVGSIAVLAVLMTAYIMVLMTPTTYWFEYKKLENVDAGKDIFMTSTYEKSVAEPLTYNDVLFCNFENGWVRFSSNLSRSLSKTSELRTVVWRYEGQTPNKPGTCEIESQIEVVVPFSIIKKQTIRSAPFAYSPLK